MGRIPDAVQFAGRRLKHPLFGGYLWHCQACTLNFRYPRLEKDVLDSLYLSGSIGAWRAPDAVRVEWSLARDLLEIKFGTGNILDIGCFDGRFLASLDSRWSVYGIELNTHALINAERAGVRILGQDFNRLDEIDELFDAVTAFDVIEHTIDPLRFLASCARRLRPPLGTLLVATGNTLSLPWRLLGARNLYCICPEHLSFINPDWCERAARKIGLQYKGIKHYRRGTHPPGKRLLDFGKSAAYSMSPSVFSYLRNHGVGTLTHPVMADHPPLWPSARDHMLAVFEKPEQ